MDSECKLLVSGISLMIPIIFLKIKKKSRSSALYILHRCQNRLNSTMKPSWVSQTHSDCWLSQWDSSSTHTHTRPHTHTHTQAELSFASSKWDKIGARCSKQRLTFHVTFSFKRVQRKEPKKILEEKNVFSMFWLTAWHFAAIILRLLDFTFSF